jgi:hypothetical protein
MANIEFMDAVESGDRAHVVVGQSVAHVEDQSLGDGVESGFAEAVQFGEACLRRAGFCVGAGVQFNGRDIEFAGFADLFDVGVDKEADEDPGACELIGALFDSLGVSDDVESAFGGDFFATFGNEGSLFWKCLQGDAGDFVGNGHFEVQSEPDCFAKDANVTILDVSAIFAEMDGDGIGTAKFGQHGSLNRVWFGSTASLANGGNVIDVNSKQGHDLGTPMVDP